MDWTELISALLRTDSGTAEGVWSSERHSWLPRWLCDNPLEPDPGEAKIFSRAPLQTPSTQRVSYT